MRIVLGALLLVSLLPSAASARPAVRQPGTTPTGFRTEFQRDLDDVQKKIISLAESVPAEQYGWRPSPDVRSISEVFTHVAGANYFLASFLGVDAPRREGDLEKTVVKKAEVLAELNRSFEHLRRAAREVEDLETPVRMFGNQTTHRGVLVTSLSHLHEHLGQLIVYARMNGIVPSWSR